MPAEKLIQFPAPEKPKKKPPKGKHASGLIRRHFRYTDLHGASRSKTVYGKTAAEAEAKKKAFLDAVRAAVRVDEQGRSVSSWVQEWLDVYKRPHVSDKRMQAIKYEVNRINDAIGIKQLKTVTQADLQRIVNSRIGLSQDAIRRTAGTIKAVFRAAVQNRLIQFSPAEGLTIPSGPTGSHRALAQREIDVVIKAAQTGHRFGVAAMLMLFAGLRKGEAADFHSRDIAGSEIIITRSVAYVVNQGEVKEPKNAAGRRAVPIMPPLAPFLDSLDGYAIPRKGNGTLSLTALRNAYNSFIRLCSQIAGKPFTFRCHDLRHTYATMLYDAGVDIKTAQRWLGHASPTLTMRLYTHLSETRQQASVKAASDHFFKVAGGKNGGRKKVYRLKIL